LTAKLTGVFRRLAARSQADPFRFMESNRCEGLLPLALYYLMTKRRKDWDS
jgi:hypothetical protein